MPQEPDGCPCESFAEALVSTVIYRHGDTFFLAGRENARGNWHSIIYGPEIKHCPFCGTKLAARPIKKP